MAQPATVRLFADGALVQTKPVQLEAGSNRVSFLVKPTDFNHYVELGSFIYDYWLGLSQSPVLSRNPAKKAQATTFGPSARQVLLRHSPTRMFYAGHRRWQSVQDAFDFERIDLAEGVALAENLRDVEIVLVYQSPSCELTVPVIFPGVKRS